MKLKVEYVQVNEKYASQAINLVLDAYNEEKQVVPFLPDRKYFLDSLNELIRNLFKNGIGIVAICDNNLIGFLCGFEVKELFGKCKGIYSPLYGHGAIKEHRKSLYQDLYKHAADIWVKKACVSHAVTFFAHDVQTINTWFWQGFGLRCVDALREGAPIAMSKTDIIIKKAEIGDISKLLKIHRLHNEYYRDSPVFMPNRDIEPEKDLTEWMCQENHHLWVAYCEEEPLGYMRIAPTAETFVSEHKDVMNIVGAYVVEKERQYGIGTALLGTIQQWLLENNYPLFGVDFEAINTVGCSFWLKYFTPYTNSLVRRIDERI